MSKKSGGQKYRERRAAHRLEHARIVAESDATYRAAFDGWERKGGQYRRIIRDAMRRRAGLDMTYRKDLKRPPSTLTVDDLAVVLMAVDGFGTSSGGLSARRINLAFGFCGEGKSLAKVAPCLRVLNSLGLVEYIERYRKGKRGNKYRLSQSCLLALGRGGATDNDFPNLPPAPTKPALPMLTPKPKRRRVVEVPQGREPNPFD